MDSSVPLTKMQKYYRKYPERVNARNKKWLADHPEAQRRKWRNRYRNNPLKWKEKRRRHRLRHAEEIRAKKSEWRKKNWPRIREQKRLYWEANRARLLAKKREYYLAHKEEILVKTRAYAKAHPEIKRETQRRMRKKRPALALAQAAQRRALKRTAALNFKDLTEWMNQVRSKKTAVCYYCGKRFPSDSVHFDHIVAISKGGQHTPDNLCVSCSVCNQSKGAKPLNLWIKHGQQMLAL